jgi:hypothetical protein
MLFLAVNAEAQYANQTGNVVGTVGGACSSAGNDYAWPDTNGNVLKCVSNVWAVQGITAAAAGSTGYIQFNNAGVLAGSANHFWDNTNNRLGIGTSAPQSLLNVYGVPVGTATYGLVSIGTSWNGGAGGFSGSASGTMIAANAASGYGGNLIDLQKNGASEFKVDAFGDVSINGSGGFTWVNRTAFSSPGAGVITVAGNFSTSFGTPANNVFQIGLADAAAAVAQTLQVQNVVAGTTNTAGQNFTINGSQGTGTGAGGAIVFKTAPAGTTGTAQNALTEALRITSAGNVGIGTAVPSGTLDVNGPIYAANGGSNGVLFKNSSGSGDASIFEGGQLNIVMGSSDTMTFDTTGNNSTALSMQASGSYSAGTAATLLVGTTAIGTNLNGGNVTLAAGDSTGTGVSSLFFQVANAGVSGSGMNTPVTAMTITGTASGTGNVGIGTTSPQATLDVKGYARLALNSSQPVACSSTNQGALALTHLARTCVCTTASTWSDVVTGAACSW